MNGIRMNQFVAPTSFITATSRLLAKIASLIVFKISTVAERSSTKASTKNTHWDTCTNVSRFFMYWAGDVTAFTFGWSWNCWIIAGASLGLSSTHRYDDGVVCKDR